MPQIDNPPIRPAMQNRIEVELHIDEQIRERAREKSVSQGQAINNITRAFYINGSLLIADGLTPLAATNGVKWNADSTKVTHFGDNRKTFRFYMPRERRFAVSSVYDEAGIAPSLVVEAALEHYAETGLITALIERPES